MIYVHEIEFYLPLNVIDGRKCTHTKRLLQQNDNLFSQKK